MHTGKRPTAAVVAMLALMCGCAHAAESATMQVNGDIRPSACAVTLTTGSGGGGIDYGTIDLAALFPLDTSGTLALPDAVVNVGVACDFPTYVGVTTMDGRAGSAAPGLDTVIAENYMGITPVPGATFGLGTSSGGAPIGAYYLHLAPQMGAITLGEGMAAALRSDDGGQNWTVLSPYGSNDASRVMLPTGVRTHSWASVSSMGDVDTEPAAVSTASFRYEIFPALLPAASLPLTGEIGLDGLATFALVYL